MERQLLIYKCQHGHYLFADYPLLPTATCRRKRPDGRLCAATLRQLLPPEAYVVDGVAYFREICPNCKTLQPIPWIGYSIDYDRCPECQRRRMEEEKHREECWQIEVAHIVSLFEEREKRDDSLHNHKLFEM